MGCEGPGTGDAKTGGPQARRGDGLAGSCGEDSRRRGQVHAAEISCRAGGVVEDGRADGSMHLYRPLGSIFARERSRRQPPPPSHPPKTH